MESIDGRVVLRHIELVACLDLSKCLTRIKVTIACLLQFAGNILSCQEVTFSFACLLLKTIKFPTEKGKLFLYLYGNLYICAQKVFIMINTL